MAPLHNSISIDHDTFSLITTYNKKYRPNCVANKYSIIFNDDTGVNRCTQYFDRNIYILCIERKIKRKYFYLYVLLNYTRIRYSHFIMIYIYCSVKNEKL